MTRLVAALPDFALAGAFLWCWFAPAAWRPTLASELGLLMVMEFFAVHSGFFFATLVGAGSRLVPLAVVIAFYLPVAGAFAYFHGGWWPVFGFAWLLGARGVSVLAGPGGEAEARAQRFYWANGAAAYILCAMAAFALPVPQLGFRRATDVFWDKWWAVAPHEVIAWGFLYFGAAGLVKLFGNPERTESE